MNNRLLGERSAYLHQHAENPVHWWPWSDEALDAARATQRPVLVSIGYSACHWCHVMAHESFEDAATAGVMNALYVNIKVDREERPDLDRIYQSAHRALTGRGGGWPLTVFIDPNDLLPFFAGTYFPPAPRHGMPAFVDVLRQVRQWYDEHPQQRREQATQLQQWLATQQNPAHGGAPDAAVMALALTRMQASHDPLHGGHQGAPKFPHCSELEWLLDQAPRKAAIESAGITDLLESTLDGMAHGGLQDHLAGGFFRYCVDAQWEIPHFEKMLYDNAQLLGVYARAAHHFGNAAYARCAIAAATWLQEDMRLDTGGFAASVDADSEGKEGRYYLWTREQVQALLDERAWPIATRRFGLDAVANFERVAWHLTARIGIDAVAEAESRTPEEVRGSLESSRRILLVARKERIAPTRDDKLLCAWNAMTIAALARASRFLASQSMLQAAEQALAAVHGQLWHNGTLRRSSSSAAPAFLDDYASLLEALLDLLCCRWQRQDLGWAIELADVLLERFEDREQGGFDFAPHGHEALPPSPKAFLDESVPSANGVAVRALLRLGHLLGEQRYLTAAERALHAASDVLRRYPEACASMLRGLQAWQYPPAHVVVRLGPDAEPAWHELAQQFPELDIWLIPDKEADLPDLLAERTLPAGINGRAWLCEGTSCQAPIDSPQALQLTVTQLQPLARR